MKNIKVKYGWEIILLLGIPIIFLTKESFENPTALTIGMNIFFVLLVLTVVFGIRYRINGENFDIKNGIFGTTKINIKEITKIEKTWNAISSPAPSLSGRVEIYYGPKSIIISPRNFDEFKTELLRINPDIEVKE